MATKEWINISQLEIWSIIAQSALNYIFISVVTNNAQKQTVLDQKVDLRATKEDIMTELKESRSVILTEIENATKSAIDIITSEQKAGSK
jgi:hypothetical protein